MINKRYPQNIQSVDLFQKNYNLKWFSAQIYNNIIICFSINSLYAGLVSFLVYLNR